MPHPVQPGGGGGGGGGAPTNASYLTLGLNAGLTDERVFTPTADLSATDGGAGGLYTLGLANTTVAPGAYTNANLTVDAKGRLTAASSGAAPVASGWTDGGTAVYLTTSTDDVSIGSNTPVTNRKLSVYNTGTDLGVSVVTLASTDNLLETFVSGEANVRYRVDGSGSTVWGAGGASAPDTRMRRTAANTLTVDNGSAGSAVWSVIGTTQTQRRIHGALTKAVADSPYTTAATDEMVFWNCVGGNCTQNLPTPVGALGRTLIVKRTDTSANTLTLTPAAGQIEGGASYVVSGGANRASVTLMSDNSNWWVI